MGCTQANIHRNGEKDGREVGNRFGWQGAGLWILGGQSLADHSEHLGERDFPIGYSVKKGPKEERGTACTSRPEDKNLKFRGSEGGVKRRGSPPRAEGEGLIHPKVSNTPIGPLGPQE